jgi:hypothetical protein
VQSDVLHDLLLLVNLALGQRHVRLSLQVVLGSVRVWSTLTLN